MNKTPEEWASIAGSNRWVSPPLAEQALEDIAELAAALRVAKREIAQLNKENLALAAAACKYRGGDEHGSPYCGLIGGSIL